MVNNLFSKFLSKIMLFISLAIVAQATVFNRSRSTDQYAVIDAHALVDIALVFLTCVLLIIALPYLQKTWRTLAGTSGRSLLWYYLLCVISALWSSRFDYTLFRAVQFLSQALAIFIIFTIYKDEDFHVVERRLLTIGVIIILLGVGMHLRQHGLFPSLRALHTNNYSASAVMVFCYCFGEFVSRREKGEKPLIVAGSISFAFLLLGTSTASYIAAFFGMTIAALLSRRMLLLFYCFLLGIIGIISLNPQDVVSILFVGKNEERIGTLSGRALLWQNYFRMILKKPIWGYGFASGNRISALYATNAHNSVLAVLLGTGMLGLIPMFNGIFRTIREFLLALRLNSPGTIGSITSISAAAVNSMSLAFVGDYWMPPSMVLVCFLAFFLFKVIDNSATPTGVIA